jgi:hypothetical protein
MRQKVSQVGIPES